MDEFDDHVAVIGDWIPPGPSPRAFFSSMISDDVATRPLKNSNSGNRSEPLFPGSEQHVVTGNADKKVQIEAVVGADETSNSNALGEPNLSSWGGAARADVGADETSNSSALGEPKLSSRGGLMERIAARAGFNAPRLKTESIRPADLSKKPEVLSPYLTIPPGLSPTTLLYSPVFLSNTLVQPSPTTGKLAFAPSGNNQDSTLMTDDPDKGKENNLEDINASSFAFKSVAESASFTDFNAANKSFADFEVPVPGSATSLPHRSIGQPKIDSVNSSVLFQEGNFCKTRVGNNGSNNLLQEQNRNSAGAAEDFPPFDEQNEDGDQSSGDHNGGGSTGEDCYNWRKYGQKHVKGSEYPRSYYKCTHPNCPVKKKVERSHEGHITGIIYKGVHNHTKPPNCRSNIGSSSFLGDMQLGSERHGTGATGDPICPTMQTENITRCWKPDNLDETSLVHLGQKFSNEATTTSQAQNGAPFESGDALDGSCTFSNDDDDDRATHGSVSLCYDGEGDELESKRRRIETYAPELSGATRAIREPRVVVQTTSEMDILDDGYRWRKYGQKVVKGNPNPRSYYKCTSSGCNVRKHVERASHDLKSVITTYEGKHNHDVPAARNSAHVNSGGSNRLSTQQAPTATGHIHRPEPSQIHGSPAWYERPSLTSYGLPPGRPQLGPDPGYGFGMSQPGLASLRLAGSGPNQGTLPVLPVHPYFGRQSRFMLPKGKPKAEPVTDTGLNSSSSVYQQLMSQLPLGPQM